MSDPTGGMSPGDLVVWAWGGVMSVVTGLLSRQAVHRDKIDDRTEKKIDTLDVRMIEHEKLVAANYPTTTAMHHALDQVFSPINENLKRIEKQNENMNAILVRLIERRNSPRGGSDEH